MGYFINLRDASTKKYTAQLEHAIKTSGFPEDTTRELRQIIVPNMLRTRPVNAFANMEHKAQCTLKKNKDTIILHAEEARMTVIPEKTDYIEKAKHQPKKTQPLTAYSILNKPYCCAKLITYIVSTCKSWHRPGLLTSRSSNYQ